MDAYQHILVPVDFSELSARVIQRGKELSEAYQCELTLLNVVEALNMGIEPFGETAGLAVNAEAPREQSQQAREQLRELANTAGLSEQTAVEIIEGLPSTAITDYAERQGVDLIIIGHSAKKGLLGFLMGSTAATVVKQAKSDVFVVQATKAEGAEENTDALTDQVLA